MNLNGGTIFLEWNTENIFDGTFEGELVGHYGYKLKRNQVERL